MKKIKSVIMVVFISLLMVFNTQETYASPFIKPKLSIGTKGIRFDKEQSGFKNAENEVGAMNAILKEYRVIIMFLSGMTSFIMISLFIFNFIKLANSKGNPQERSKSVMALIFTGAGTALAGSATLVTQLFYNFL